MRYLSTYSLFENLKKAEAVISAYKKYRNLDDDQKEDIEKLKSMVPIGYYGKLVEFYLNERQYFNKIEWIANKLKSFKLKNPIDSYKKYDDVFKELSILYLSNKIKKLIARFSIKGQLNITFIAEEISKHLPRVTTLNINSYGNELDAFTFSDFNNVRTNEDFIKVITSKKKDYEIHKDWNVLMNNENYLVYEIISYKGAIELCSVEHCIRHESMYRAYKKRNTRFFNIIDKHRIDDSIFFDIGPDPGTGEVYNNNYIMVFRWNDTILFSGDINRLLEKGKFTSPALDDDTLLKYQDKLNIVLDLLPKIITNK